MVTGVSHGRNPCQCDSTAVIKISIICLYGVGRGSKSNNGSAVNVKKFSFLMLEVIEILSFL